MKPVIIVNFKTYEKATGKKALKLAEKIYEHTKNSKSKWIICPQHVDIWIAKHVKIPVYAQHVDALEPGRGTGYITPFSLKAYGVKGSLINHSEHRLPVKEIKARIEILKKYNMVSVVCANTVREASMLAKLKPDYIAVEPPELIGSGISVSEAKPEIIEKSAKIVKKQGVKFLCGAGISKGEDVKKALELGADGVLVASAIANSKNPVKVIKDFIRGAEL